jgi:hypothetical protein
MHDEFLVKAVNNLADVCKLLQVDFEYIGPMHGHELFRKRK